MKIIAIERELSGASSELFQRYAKEEARAAWDLYLSGDIRELYYRADQSAAVLMLESENTAAAELILSGLPFVREGFIQFDLIPLAAYPGFARLFEHDGQHSST